MKKCAIDEENYFHFKLLVKIIGMPGILASGTIYTVSSEVLEQKCSRTMLNENDPCKALSVL